MNRDFIPIDVGAHMTPDQIETHLKKLYNELAFAQIALRDRRDEEVSAKLDYQRARSTAILSPDCPKVSRKDGGATVDERDAWVDLLIEAEKSTLALAEVNRANAEDYLRMLRQQAEIVRSLGTSVRQAYEMAGRAEK